MSCLAHQWLSDGPHHFSHILQPPCAFTQQLPCCVAISALFAKDDQLDDLPIVSDDEASRTAVPPLDLELFRLCICQADVQQRAAIGALPALLLSDVESQGLAQICNDRNAIVIPDNLAPQRPYKAREILLLPGPGPWLLVISTRLRGRRQVPRRQPRERDARRHRVPVDAQGAAALAVRPVEEHVVGADELGARHGLDAHAEDLAAVDGVGVRVAHLEGGDAGAGAVQALLLVGLLLLRVGLDLLVLAAGARGGAVEELARGDVGQEG